LLMIVEVSLRHIPVLADMCLDAATEGRRVGRTLVLYPTC
jgi:hypothetical protein